MDRSWATKPEDPSSNPGQGMKLFSFKKVFLAWCIVPKSSTSIRWRCMCMACAPPWPPWGPPGFLECCHWWLQSASVGPCEYFVAVGRKAVWVPALVEALNMPIGQVFYRHFCTNSGMLSPTSFGLFWARPDRGCVICPGTWQALGLSLAFSGATYMAE